MSAEPKIPSNGYLCIGGPFDGRLFAAASTGFAVPIKEHARVDPWRPWDDQALPVRTCRYTLERFVTPHRDFHVWRPEGQSLAATMALLLTAYAEARGRSGQTEAGQSSNQGEQP